MYPWCEYEYLFRAISGDFATTKEPSRQYEIPGDSLNASSSPEFQTRPMLDAFQFLY